MCLVKNGAGTAPDRVKTLQEEHVSNDKKRLRKPLRTEASARSHAREAAAPGFDRELAWPMNKTHTDRTRNDADAFVLRQENRQAGLSIRSSPPRQQPHAHARESEYATGYARTAQSRRRTTSRRGKNVPTVRYVCAAKAYMPDAVRAGCRIRIPDYGKPLTHDTVRKVAAPYRKFSFRARKDTLIQGCKSLLCSFCIMTPLSMHFVHNCYA